MPSSVVVEVPFSCFTRLTSIYSSCSSQIACPCSAATKRKAELNQKDRSHKDIHTIASGWMINGQIVAPRIIWKSWERFCLLSSTFYWKILLSKNLHDSYSSCYSLKSIAWNHPSCARGCVYKQKMNIQCHFGRIGAPADNSTTNKQQNNPERNTMYLLCKLPQLKTIPCYFFLAALL